MSYGVMRPGFNTPVGRVLFRICENWIGVGECGVVFGGVFGGVIVPKCLTHFIIFLLKYEKTIICPKINTCVIYIFTYIPFFVINFLF